MQMEVIFLGHIVGQTGLACNPAKLSVVRDWHVPDKVKAVWQFVCFVGYYRRIVKDFAELVEPLVAIGGRIRYLVGPPGSDFCVVGNGTILWM